MEEEKDFESFVKLKDGLSLMSLMGKGSEFTLAEEEENLWADSDVDKQVDTLYEFEDFEKHINLDCIQCDPSDVNVAGSPFEIISAKMKDVTPDGKVKKKILRSGSNRIPDGAVVYLHYNKYLEMQEVPFDSSYLQRKDPVRFQVGRGSAYAGFEIAVCSMCVGEKAQFLIHPDLAYGKLGAPPRIPPEATILAVIEVFKAVDCGQIREEESISVNDRKDFGRAYKLAKSAHERANDFFSTRNVPGAVEYYRRAENLLLNCSVKSDEEEEKMKYLLLKIYVNLTVCFNTEKFKHPEKVCIAAKKAIELDPQNAFKNAKLFYHRGLANQGLCNFKLASKDFNRALKLEPNNEAINKAIRTLDEKQKAYHEYEKEMGKKFLAFKDDKEMDDKENFNEIGEECRSEVTKILQNFANDTAASFQLGTGFTFVERSWIKHETERLGLVYQDSIVDGKRQISIKKA
uniref:peptidylprolyl isomerase n=1 Tax=Lygus hesperus TaxID=30085 RepID=A0A0A9YHD0_LYGHE